MRLVVFNCIWIALGSFRRPSVDVLQEQLGISLFHARVTKVEGNGRVYIYPVVLGSLRRRAFEHVAKLAQATNEWLLNERNAVTLNEFGVTWQNFKDDNRKCEAQRCTGKELVEGFSAMENKLIGMMGGSYKERLSTDLLDHDTIFWTIFSDVRYILVRKNDERSLTADESALRLGIPLVDAAFELMNEPGKAALIYEYLRLMRPVGFDGWYPKKRSEDVLKFSKSVEKLLKKKGDTKMAEILSKRRRAIEVTLPR